QLSTMSTTPKLPPFASLTNRDALANALTILFEPSPTLIAQLAPALEPAVPVLASYESLIDLSVHTLLSLPADAQATFIAGHPRIGEVSGLSALSTAEQARVVTSTAVLARLALLNALYEKRYTGLRYITFVNGRTRAEVAREMENKLEIEHSLDAETPSVDDVEPTQDQDAWQKELKRAVEDVGRIAKSRLKVLL
ncbi:Oxo-4-hydroxy-4-carboxy-5-ureidoimidazoline decarboxylase, partial [Auriculariales sp. MPI-PUGE-AT-0066]